MQPYTGQAGKMNATSGVSDMSGGRQPVVRRSGAVRDQLPLLRHAFVRSLHSPLAVHSAVGPVGKGQLPERSVRDLRAQGPWTTWETR